MSPEMNSWNPTWMKLLCVLSVSVLLAYFFCLADKVSIPSSVGGIAQLLTSYVKIDDESENMNYCDDYNPRVERCGETFNESWIPVLESFNLTDRQIARVTEEDDRRIVSTSPVFVTAFSDNHFGDAQRHVFPQIRLMTSANNTKIVVYDLGLNETNLNELRKQPSLEIRHFNFSLYPSYVQDLFQFRWKPLIIADALQKHDAIFYADTHFHWKQEMNLTDLLKKVRCLETVNRTCDFINAVFLAGADLSIFALTDPKMYNYLPIDVYPAMKTEMGHAAILLFYNTRAIRSRVTKWFVLCALEQRCMIPEGSKIPCHHSGEEWSKRHRWTTDEQNSDFDETDLATSKSNIDSPPDSLRTSQEIDEEVDGTRESGDSGSLLANLLRLFIDITPPWYVRYALYVVIMLYLCLRNREK